MMASLEPYIALRAARVAGLPSLRDGELMEARRMKLLRQIQFSVRLPLCLIALAVRL